MNPPRITRLSVIAVMAFVGGGANAQLPMEQWQYSKLITIERTGQYIVIPLDNETHDLSQESLADLRIATNDNQEKPYHLLRGETLTTPRTTFTSRLLNNSHSPNGYTTVIVDLKNRGLEHNQVHLDIPGHNFRRRVEVYGSDKPSTWNLLRSDAAVFDFSSVDDSIRMTTVRYPASIFRLLKIHILDEGSEPLRVSDATVMMQPPTKRHSRMITPTIMEVAHDPRKNRSFVMLDAGARNLPLVSLTLTIDEPNFYRHVQVFAGNDTAHLQQAGSGILYRFSTERYHDSKLDLPIGHASGRFIRLVIMNRNDRPLTIHSASVEILQYEIVVKPISGSVVLWLGNKRATAPQYDLSNELQYAKLDGAGIGKLEIARVNERYEEPDPRPWSERNPVILWIAFAGVFLVLVALVLRLARASRPGSSAQ